MTWLGRAEDNRERRDDTELLCLLCRLGLSELSGIWLALGTWFLFTGPLGLRFEILQVAH